MNKEAAQYIETELDLSRLRLSSLAESITLSEAARKRLMDIETDLQSLDFSSLDIETKKDAESAIRLFRSSRKNFSSVYSGKSHRTLNKFYDFISKESTIYKESIKSSDFKLKLKRIIIARSILKILNELNQRNIDKEIQLDIISLLLDNDTSKIFSLYNDSLSDVLSELREKKIKEPKISPLINLVREHGQEKEFNVENLLFYGKNRLGIMLPKDEANRETLWVAYKKISIFGNDLSNIFEDNASNVNINGSYQKAILLKNKDEILKNKDVSKYYFLLSLFFQNSLSNRHKATVILDNKNSSILITKSRTDDQTLKKIINDFIVDAKKH